MPVKVAEKTHEQVAQVIRGYIATDELRVCRPRYYENRKAIGKRDLIVQELDRLPEQDLDRLLAFLHSLSETHAEAAVSLTADSLIVVNKIGHISEPKLSETVNRIVTILRQS